MRREELKLSNLTKFDNGIVEELFREEIKNVVRDITDRPGEGKAREVHLVFRFSPADKTDPDCEHVNFQFQVFSKLPKRQSRVYPTAAHANQSLSFHPDFIDDPSADGLFDEHDGEQPKGGNAP